MDRGRRLDVAWESMAPRLGAADRAWAHAAVFGLIRLRGRIDFLLDRHLHRGIESLPDPILRVLRLGAYQLLYMGSVPMYAAVSQTVGQAEEIGGRRATGLVNAVLRALADAGGQRERFPSLERDPARHLETWGSHPRWLVDRWLERFGAEGTARIVDAGNRVPQIFIRPVGCSADRAATALVERGVMVSPGPPGSETLRLPAGTDLGEIFATIPAVVQDPAATGVVNFLQARAGETLADLCAAPGGKSVVLSGAGVRVFASDPSRPRLRRVVENLERLGLPVRLVAAKGEDPAFHPVDIVLVDAPCTGTATLSRHPDARWRLGPSDPATLAGLQGRILEGAARIVKPGGRLVYATCTVESEENDAVVATFLARHEEFRLDREADFYRVLPGEISADGAFAARLVRSKG